MSLAHDELKSEVDAASDRALVWTEVRRIWTHVAIEALHIPSRTWNRDNSHAIIVEAGKLPGMWPVR